MSEEVEVVDEVQAPDLNKVLDTFDGVFAKLSIPRAEHVYLQQGVALLRDEINRDK